MIYNGASNIVSDLEYENSIPKMVISNNLKPIMEGDLHNHLKSYSFYNEAVKLYKTVDLYNDDIKNLYNDLFCCVQNAVNKYFKEIKPVEHLPADCEGYRIGQVFKAVMYHIFQKTDFKIINPSQNDYKYFTFAYKVNESYYGMFFSKDKKNMKIFEESIMSDIISKFKDEFINIGEKSNGIDAELKISIKELLKISSEYNSEFPIKGECEDCKSIKDVKKLVELIPPN